MKKKNLTRRIISSSCFYSKVKKKLLLLRHPTLRYTNHVAAISLFKCFFVMSNNVDFMHRISNFYLLKNSICDRE